MTFKIEKDVPIPEKYPFSKMGVGDSFDILDAGAKEVSAAVSYYGKKHGKKFTVRKTADGHRCWRIE